MSVLSFPNPVNEKAARSVAALVVVLAVTVLVTGSPWLLALLALGFWARVASGPRFSVFGQLATRVIAPRLGAPRLVPGPPKRFAQGIGAVLTTGALAALLLGAPLLAWVLLGALVVAASLEAFLGLCLGCLIFGRLQRAGVIPAAVCEACNSVGRRVTVPTGTRPS